MESSEYTNLERLRNMIEDDEPIDKERAVQWIQEAMIVIKKRTAKDEAKALLPIILKDCEPPGWIYACPKCKEMIHPGCDCENCGTPIRWEQG